MFEVLLRERRYEPSKVESWFASHPMEARIERARNLIGDLGLGAEGNLLIDTPNFQAFKARVNALPPPPELRQLPPCRPEPPIRSDVA